MSPPDLDWEHDEAFRVGETAFRFTFEADSRVDDFCIRKPRELVESVVALLAEVRPRTVVELGISQGGSTALLDLLLPDARILAIELSPERIPALDDHLARRGRAEEVRAEYGVSQDDVEAVDRLVDEHFGGAPVDLVLDDASHYLDPTTASFDLLFPRLRTGGVYVIEDWRWQHKMHRSARDSWDHNPVGDSGKDRLRSTLAGDDAAAAARARTLIARKLADEASPERAALARRLAEAAEAPDLPENRALLDRIATHEPTPTEPPQPVYGLDTKPLVRLLLELVLAHADDVTSLARLTIDDHWIRVDRGPTAPGADFSIVDRATDPFEQLRPRP